MSWSLNVSGHVNTGDLEQDRQVEAALLDEVKRFVASLPIEAGVSYGTWSGQHSGGAQLAAPAQRPPATHEEAAMVEGFRGAAGEPERAID